MKSKRIQYRTRWWQYAEKRPALNQAIANLQRTLAIAQVSKRMAFAFVPTRNVFSQMLAILPYDTYAPLCALQARIHEIWTLTFGSSFEDRLIYTTSDCFGTFPFVDDWETDPALEVAGRNYYRFRADLMVRNDEGLTTIYNRIHNPNETSSEIQKLRELHSAMDQAVLAAYGWPDAAIECEFLPEYETDQEDVGGRKAT